MVVSISVGARRNFHCQAVHKQLSWGPQDIEVNGSKCWTSLAYEIN